MRAGSPCSQLSGLARKKSKTASVRNQSQGHRTGGPEDPSPKEGHSASSKEGEEGKAVPSPDLYKGLLYNYKIYKAVNFCI